LGVAGDDTFCTVLSDFTPRNAVVAFLGAAFSLLGGVVGASTTESSSSEAAAWELLPVIIAIKASSGSLETSAFEGAAGERLRLSSVGAAFFGGVDLGIGCARTGDGNGRASSTVDAKLSVSGGDLAVLWLLPAVESTLMLASTGSGTATLLFSDSGVVKTCADTCTAAAAEGASVAEGSDTDATLLAAALLAVAGAAGGACLIEGSASSGEVTIGGTSAGARVVAN
jgi:hypothetical protein